uniref:Inhibitory synaptic factor 2A n=1 Tax=Nothoprocta perdicaria TaxID=30464 RepID=A0A8C7E964_NOTPE
MVSKEPSKCLLTSSESEVEPAASLALEMKYALDPNRQIKKRNKALQVRFKDICEAQSEQQRDRQLSAGQEADKREAKAISYKTAYRKYMTVPARRSIPNVTKSTGVQTSPDLKKCYQTFPLDRKKGNISKSASAVDTFKSQNNGFLMDIKDKEGSGSAEALRRGRQGGSLQTAAFVSPAPERSATWHSWAAEPPALLHAEQPRRGEAPAAAGGVFKTEVAAVYLPAAQGGRAESAWALCPGAEEAPRRTAQLNGEQAAAPSSAATAPAHQGRPCEAAGDECRQIVPHTEVVDLKAQLQVMESLISSSQETIKVLLGVIQELEKGEAHREGLSYRTGQDTANCDTCRNSACIIYSVELDFKQQEDKLQPVLRKLHPIEETQVAPLPYSQESYSSTPKQKSKTESKKHGRWKLWFL